MGFSLAAAFAVIGGAVIISVEILTGGLIPTITDVHDAYDDMVNRGIDKVQTDINITDVTVSPNGSNYDHNITLENTGSITLKTNNFIILIDGTIQQFRCLDSYLYPEKETYLIINNLSGIGTKRLKIITDNGISDYYEYTI